MIKPISIQEIVTLWREVKKIKNRCQSVTPEEMAKVDRLVRWFNEETKDNRKPNLKSSACQIPNISFRVGTLLKSKAHIKETESIYI